MYFLVYIIITNSWKYFSKTKKDQTKSLHFCFPDWFENASTLDYRINGGEDVLFFSNCISRCLASNQTSEIWIGPTDIQFGVNMHSDKCYISQCPYKAEKLFWRKKDPWLSRNSKTIEWNQNVWYQTNCMSRHIDLSQYQILDQIWA